MTLEQRLLKAFRQLDDRDQEEIVGMAESWLKQVATAKAGE